MFVPAGIAAETLSPLTPQEPPKWLNFDENIYEATVRVEMVVGFTQPYGNPDGRWTSHTYAQGAVIEIEEMWWGPDYVPGFTADKVWIPLWRQRAWNPMAVVYCTIENTGWKF